MSPGVILHRTRFAGLGVRHYRDCSRVGVPGHRRSFRETWWRFVDVETDSDIGASYPTKAEIYASLESFAAERGFEVAQ